MVCVMSAGFAGQAAAQTAPEEMEFEDLITEAQTAYKDEDYGRAIELLLAADRRQPNARLLLNVAKSHEKAGDCVEALAYYRAFIRDPGAEENLVPTAEKMFDKAAKDCDGWDDLLAGRLQISSTPSGATVSVDGEEVGTTPMEVVALMEGPRKVRVTLEGYEPAEETVDLKPDADATVELTLEEEPEEVVVAEPVEPPPEPEPEPDTGPSPVIHYAIAGGIGALGAGLFTVGALTDSSLPGKYDEPRREDDITPDEFDQLTEERKAASTRALIFYISGSALLAGGVGYAIYTAVSSSEKETAPQLTIAPSVAADGVGVVLSGDF